MYLSPQVPWSVHHWVGATPQTDGGADSQPYGGLSLKVVIINLVMSIYNIRKFSKRMFQLHNEQRTNITRKYTKHAPFLYIKMWYPIEWGQNCGIVKLRVHCTNTRELTLDTLDNSRLSFPSSLLCLHKSRREMVS